MGGEWGGEWAQAGGLPPWGLVAAWWAAAGALAWFVWTCDALLVELYGHRGRGRGRGREERAWRRVGDWVRVWAAMVVDVAAFVPAAACAVLSDRVEWSGVVYTKRGGLVRDVKHIHRKLPD